MADCPVILLAFANDRTIPGRHLASLSKEQAALEDALAPAIKEGLCEVEVLTGATVDDIIDAFQRARYRDRIAVFHFAGHADGYQLLLESFDEGNVVAHGAGLVSFFSRQNGLRLVFLNGCSTQRQAQDLIDAGVPAVIGTYMSIEDSKASTISARFYKGLGQGHNIDRAWQEARDEIRIRTGDGTTRDFVFQSINNLPGSLASQFPWQIYYREGAEIVREWNLPKAANNPLFGLPKIHQLQALPERPYLFLRRFEREHAAIFFGRGHEIRNLYQHLSDPAAPPVLLLYGQSGVGKSSLLEAGVLPRLEQKHQVLYLRRDPALGLRGTVRGAISSGREMDVEAIRQYWKLRESEQDKPLILLLDQVEEVFTRPIENQPRELQDFLEFVRAILDEPAQRPRGKLVLGYRKEFHAEIEQLCRQLEIPRDLVFVEKLNRRGIIEVITGLTSNEYLRNHYQLEIEPLLPEIIADDLLVDRESPIAPVLQILLTKMWDRTVAGGPPTFDNEKYLELSRAGILLDDFFREQMEQIRTWNSEVADSGLALDVLHLHTTDMGTAQSRSLRELRVIYPHQLNILDELIRRFKASYLLTDRAPAETGLAHDTLAPLIQKEIRNSEKVGQRALRILTAKMLEFEKEEDGTYIDEADLLIVEAGASGMRGWNKQEQQLIARSRQRRAELEAGRKRNRRFRRLMFAIVTMAAIAITFFAWDQYWTARANDLSAKARQMAIKDASIGLRLAEAALEAKGSSENARQALVDIFNTNEFYGVALPHRSAIMGVEISSDGDLLLTYAQDNNGRLWNRKGELLAILKGHSTRIIAAAISPDGNRIITSGRDNKMVIWNTDGGVLDTIDVSPRPVNDLSFTPDGKAFIGGTLGYVKEWDLRGGLRRQWEVLTGDVKIVEVASDGQLYLAGSQDRIAVWDPSETAEITMLPMEGSVSSASFCCGDRASRVLTTSGPHAFLWSLEKSDPSPPIKFASAGKTLLGALYGSHDRLVYGIADHETIVKWNLAGEIVDQLHGHQEGITDLTFSADGRFMVSGSRDGTAKVWDLYGKMAKQYKGFKDRVRAIAIDRDATLLAAASGSDLHLIFQNEAKRNILQKHSGRINDVVIVDEERKLISAGTDSSLIFWSLSGEVSSVIRGPEPINAIDYSPEGPLLLAGGKSGNLYLWDLSGSETTMDTLAAPIPNRQVRSVQFSRNGQRFLSGGHDRFVRLWSVKRRMETGAMSGPALYIIDAAWIDKEKYILVGNSNEQSTALLLSNNGSPIVELAGHQPMNSNDLFLWQGSGEQAGGVNSVDFTEKEQLILTAGMDGTARVWDMSGNQIQIFSGHSSVIHQAIFTPDGKSIITAGADSTIVFTNTIAGFLSSDRLITLDLSQTGELGLSSKNYGYYQTAETKEQLLAYAYYFEDKAFAQTNRRDRLENLQKAIELHDLAWAKSLSSQQDPREAAELRLEYAHDLLRAGKFAKSAEYFAEIRALAPNWVLTELPTRRWMIPYILAQLLIGEEKTILEEFHLYFKQVDENASQRFLLDLDNLTEELKNEKLKIDRPRIEAFKATLESLGQ